jgi:hypothetical protein
MPKTDVNMSGWEQSDFPILCETCTFDYPRKHSTFADVRALRFGRQRIRAHGELAVYNYTSVQQLTKHSPSKSSAAPVEHVLGRFLSSGGILVLLCATRRL